MIVKLDLTNYRGFDRHELTLGPLTVVVGRNNAGKSTVVEALRVVALGLRRLKTMPYKDPPPWTNRPKRDSGVLPSVKDFGLDFETLPHAYGDPPSEICATMSDGATVNASLGHGVLFVSAAAGNGEPVKSRRGATDLELPRAEVMPQLGPLAKEEVVLTEDHIRASVDSHLASNHFRNQLNTYQNLLADFRENAAETWPGVKIEELEGLGDKPERPLNLLMRIEDYVGEVGNVGHGLQMWLQMIWFLTRARGANTVILDEPDVYLHPDLQRRLIRFLRGRFPQVVLTSHSVELISEVDPDEVLVVDRGRLTSTPTTSLPAVQAVLEEIGSTHNVHLARLWKARRMLLVEGDDVRILQRLHSMLFPASESLGSLPSVSIGGWGGWQRAIGSALVIKNALDEDIGVYCLLDRDFHTDTECAQRVKDAADRDIRLHIWMKKEIENYLLSPTATARSLADRATKNLDAVTPETIVSMIDKCAADLEQETVDSIASHIHAGNRSLSLASCNQKARSHYADRITACGSRVAVVSGKNLLRALSRLAQNKFGVGLSAVGLAARLQPDEIDPELVQVLETIEDEQMFE